MEKEKITRVEQFLKKHMLKSSIPEYTYQYCVFLYYEYLVDGLSEAEKIENGEVFDEFRIIALVNEMQEAWEVIQIMKKSLKHKTKLYDISEQITFPGGCLAAGIFTGDTTAAAAAAREWIVNYQYRMDNPFLFEAGVYILTLLGEEIEIKHQ